MALTYPLDTPTTIGIESITLRSVNAVALSQSPFTFKQQVVAFPGQRWEVSVNIPSTLKDKSADWVAMLVGLKGQIGTFLIGDPDYATPRGDVSSCVVTGLAGEDSLSVVMTGTLKAGDYIQLGTGSNSRLYKVLEDLTGDGTLEVWPNLRSDYTSASAVYNNAKGVFRLSSNVTEWSINNASAYGISFEATEVVT